MLNRFLGRYWCPLSLKFQLSSLGKRAKFAGPATVYGAKHVVIGDDFFCGRSFYLSTSLYVKVTIGHAVMLGPDVMILGGDHLLDHTNDHMRFNQAENAASANIVIEDGAWLGARTVILSGAHIGEGAVIGAGSIVRQAVPPYSVALGNRLRVIRSRFSERCQLQQMLENVQSKYSVDEVLALYRKSNISLPE